MKLSSYLAKNEKKWNDIENANIHRLMSYLEKHIDVNLCEMAKSDNEVKAFKSLEGWLFNFYPNEFQGGLAHIGYDYQNYQKKLIYSFILSVVRNRFNINMLYDMLISKEVITKMLTYEDDKYEIITENFGNIPFKKADNAIDHEVEQYLKSLGEQVIDGCHEISFFLIKKNPNLKAITSICTKGLGCNYYHSFIIDGINVMDLTANLIMPKEQYYLLNNVQELNVINYDEYLLEEKDCKEFGESKTLYELLRNALYKQFLAENKQT